MEEKIKTPKEIGKAISAFLRKNRITHEEAARRLGLPTKQIVSNHTGGGKRISRQKAARYAETFGFSEEFLLLGKGNLLESESTADRYAELMKIIKSQQDTIETLSRLPRLATDKNNESTI